MSDETHDDTRAEGEGCDTAIVRMDGDRFANYDEQPVTVRLPDGSLLLVPGRTVLHWGGLRFEAIS